MQRQRKDWTIQDIPVADAKTNETVVITGANSGVGFELAKQLAAKNYSIIMACRDEVRGNQACQQIRDQFPEAKVSMEKLDLSDFESVRDFAERMKKKGNPIGILVNNGGIMEGKPLITSDNCEIVFQTNYLGHFMLTALLLPLLESAKSPRVITVSSDRALGENTIDVDHLQETNKGIHSIIINKAYDNSKAALLMFSVELARRLKESGSHIISIAASPGYTKTNILNHSQSALKLLFFKLGNAVAAQSVDKGVIPMAYACVGKDVNSGEFYGPDGSGYLRGDHPKLMPLPNNHTFNDEIGGKLWEATEKLLKTPFVISKHHEQAKEKLLAYVGNNKELHAALTTPLEHSSSPTPPRPS